MRPVETQPVPYHMQSPVLLAQPMLDRVLTWFFGALIVAALLFCSLTTYGRTEPARGEVSAASGFSAVAVEDSGTVSVVLVHSGQRVVKGQPLLLLAKPQVVAEHGDTTAFSLRQMQAAIQNIDLQLAGSSRAADAAREQIAQIRRGADVSRSAASARRGLTEQRRQVALSRLHGIEELAGEGIVTQMAVDQARVQSMQVLQESADADLTINEIARGRDERVATLDAKIRDLEQSALTLRTERLQTEKQIVDLQARQALTIVAPAAGTVAAVSVRPGQRVEAGQRLLAVAKPSVRLAVVLQVPSKAIGLIERDQRVSLKYDAFPYQSFGLRYGRVIRVESASLESGADASAEDGAADRKFLVEVAPEEDFVTAYGRRRSLRVGMMVTADVEVERRSILAWWLGPLLSMTGRLA